MLYLCSSCEFAPTEDSSLKAKQFFNSEMIFQSLLNNLSDIVWSNKNHLRCALWTNRRDAVIVDMLCVYWRLKAGWVWGGVCMCVWVCGGWGCALWGVWAVELWSSRAKQPKTKAHNSRGLHSRCTAFNANRADFHTPLIAWIVCLLNS